MSTPENKSYLASGWTPRTATPQPTSARNAEDVGGSSGESTLRPQRGGDHLVSHRHRLSLRNYPRDCPPLLVQWFHAVDLPKYKPLPSGQIPKDDKPPIAPKKWQAFSKGDSRAIEVEFQKLSEEADTIERTKLHVRKSDAGLSHDFDLGDPRASQHTEGEEGRRAKIAVNEDYLFDVDIEKRELAPAYWLGPVYEVRRGTWFYHDGTSLRPCDENLAVQLEEGYLKLKAWRQPAAGPQRSASQSKSRPTSLRVGDDMRRDVQKSISSQVTPKSSRDNLRSAVEPASPDPKTQAFDDSSTESRTHRLFGEHMNSVVTYQDATTAWMLTDDFMSRMSSTMYQRFAGGAHFAGQKLVRGYSDLSKKDEKRPSSPSRLKVDAENDKAPAKDKQKPAATDEHGLDADKEEKKPASDDRRRVLERHMSSLVGNIMPDDPEKQAEEIRKRDELEIQDDYAHNDRDEQGRDIEHLVLVTHGIGQRLGLRMDAVNFVHDVNTMRKTLKSVYSTSTDLQALNGEVETESKNCRVQVLPICWRHRLDFPKQSLKHNAREQDLGDIDFDEEEYPSLDDITVEGVPAVRNLVTDLVLDILLYQSPAYKGHITRIVLEECNRIYRLWKLRNPHFKGRVSLAGHSLGSAIMFDILCRQRDEDPSKTRHRHRRSTVQDLQLDFDVDDFYALGSPVGLFQMLKGRTIAARHQLYNNDPPAETPIEADDNDPFSHASSRTKTAYQQLEITTSAPKCERLFNIFHPTDPVSYRIEPLISPAMAALRPQPLPYTKRGIFGAPVGQGLTGIGARVGQSMSGLWSSFSGSIASSLLNRTLGVSAEDEAGKAQQVAKTRAPLSMGAGKNPATGAGTDPSPPNATPPTEQTERGASDDKKAKVAEEAIAAGDVGERPPTLIDSDIETLYSGFDKRRKSQQSDSDIRDLGENQEWQELEERSRRLKREEAKVRALNTNGRVDYSIQEGAFDISLIASIASHLSYWADEDVSHFIISQLLARHRVLKRSSKQEAGKPV